MVHYIARCADGLSSWAATTFGCIKKKIKVAGEKLRVAQAQSPDADMLQQCNSLASELNVLHQQEESY